MACEWFYFTLSKLTNSLTKPQQYHFGILSEPTLVAVVIVPHPRAYGDFGTLIGFDGWEELKFASE